MSSNGKCIIVSAPSGAGKTTIVRYLLDQALGLKFSVSATSRSPRIEEIDGHDYHFMSASDFEQRIKKEDFVEWEEVYPSQYYGTLKEEIARIWAEDKHVVFDVDVVGGLNLKEHFKDKALSVFIQPPTVEALEARLRSRRSESDETMKLRLDKAGEELARAAEFDVIVVNEVLDVACNEAERIVKNFLDS